MAVIGGGGYWGKNHNRVVHNLPGVDFLYICDRDPKTGERLKQTAYTAKFTTDFNEVLNDPAVHAVVISTPLFTHHELTMKALEAGKHVFVEKPMASTVKECEEMNAAAKKAGKILMVGHTYVYNPVVQSMKEKFLDTGDLGPLIGMHFVRDGPSPVRDDADSLWDLAPHDISMLLYFGQSYPSLIRVIGRSTHQASVGRENVIRTWIDTPAYPITIDSSCTGAEKKRTVTVQGKDYTLVFDDMAMENKLVKRKTPHGTVKDGQLMNVVETPRGEPLTTQAKAFLHAIRTGERPISDGIFGLQVVQILEAAKDALESGNSVRIRGGLYNTRGDAYMSSPRLEIVAATKPMAEDKVKASHLGRVDFDNISYDKQDVLGALEKVKESLPLNKTIGNLHSLQVNGDGIEYGIKSSLYHKHEGLNRPPMPSNLAVYNKLPNPSEIATQAGVVPVTAMTVILTEDNKVIMGRRSHYTATVGSQSLLASGFHWEEDVADGNPSLFGTVRRKYQEDTGAPLSTIKEITQHGITYADEMNRGFGVAHLLKIALTSMQLHQAFLQNKVEALQAMAQGQASSPLVHTEFLEIEFTPESIKDYIVANSEGLDMHSAGALLLVGKNVFENGDVWYERMIHEVLPLNFGRVLPHATDKFSTKHTVQEFISTTQLERYRKKE